MALAEAGAKAEAKQGLPFSAGVLLWPLLAPAASHGAAVTPSSLAPVPCSCKGGVTPSENNTKLG